MRALSREISMLEFNGVTFQYESDTEPMLTNLSLSVEDGEFVSIIGESGCGKTTLFRLINGLERPQRGEITVDGQPVYDVKGYSAYMPQKDLLLPWRTVLQNVCLPMELRGADKSEMRQAAENALAAVGLEGWGEKYPRELSGGMRQRASFARTLTSGSSLLLLDEPFSALDSLTKMDMQEWLMKRCAEFRRTALFITHDVEEAIFLSDRIFVITERPFSRIQVKNVPLPRPRRRADMRAEEISLLKEELTAMLRRDINEK